MKSFRATIVFPLFGLLASLAACSGEAQTTETGANETPVVANVEASDKKFGGPRMMHGPESLLFGALHEDINLTDAQRTTIKDALKALAPKGPPPNKGALTTAIRSGKIDTAALAIKPEGFEARKAALAAALTTLHSTLSEEQRSALVAAVTKRVAETASEHKDGPKHGFKHGGPKGEGHHFGGPLKMLDGLDLTREQKDTIKSKLDAARPAKPSDADITAMKANHEAMKKEMNARLQTFATDSFDANVFLAPPANAPAKMADHGDRMINDLAIIVSVLTPEQREKLATKMEKGPAAPAQ